MTSGSADLVCLPMCLSFGVLQTALRCGHNAGAGRRAASRFQVHAAAGKAIWLQDFQGSCVLKKIY